MKGSIRTISEQMTRQLLDRAMGDDPLAVFVLLRALKSARSRLQAFLAEQQLIMTHPAYNAQIPLMLALEVWDLLAGDEEHPCPLLTKQDLADLVSFITWKFLKREGCCAA